MQREKTTNRLLHEIGKLERQLAPEHALASFLNEAQTDRTATFEIFELCRQLDTLRTEQFETPTQRSSATSRQSSILERLDEAVSKFQFRPALIGCFPFAEKEGPMDRYTIYWTGKRVADDKANRLPAANFVIMILELTEAGALDRIRQCICKRWFFAQSKKKQVCSGACRFQKFKQATKQTFNKQRAAYMRDYRNNPMATKRKKTTHVKKQK